MKRIVLACSAGMSTSLVVTKMEREAEARGLAFHIYAIPEQNLRDELQSFPGEVAAVLLGPQVRFKLAANKAITDAHQVPIGVIDSVAYGTLNGAKVLDQALGLIN